MMLWIYQHYILPKLTWALMIHDLALSFVRHLDAIVRRFLKKWLHLPRGANVAFLFIGTKKCSGLRMRRLETVYKQMQVVKLDIIRHAQDENVRGVFQVIETRQKEYKRRHAPATLLRQAEEEVRVAKAVQSRPRQGGLGYKGSKQELTERKVITNAIAEMDRQSLIKHLHELEMQGRFVEWNGTMSQDFTWKRLLYEGNGNVLQFAIKATINVLPTRDNIRRWGGSVLEAKCPLCGWRSATLRHVLNGCPVGLNQHRYTWRHDSILQEIGNGIREALMKPIAPPAEAQGEYLQFVRAGEQPKKQSARRELYGLFQRSDDWTMLLDGPSGRVQIPSDMAVTVQRPDIVVYSRKLKRVIFGELTSPWEDRVLEAQALKTAKYASLMATVAENGWNVDLYTIEVGSRGYVAPTLRTFLEALDLPYALVKSVMNKASAAAVRCSYVIYLSRDIPEWHQGVQANNQ